MLSLAIAEGSFSWDRKWDLKIIQKICIALALLLPCGCNSMAAWHDAEIGTPATKGSSAFADGTLKVTGCGTGAELQADQLHFTSIPLPSGDFEAVVRLKALQGPAQAQAGVMVRADASPTS